MFIMHCHNICLAIDETKVTLLTLSAISGRNLSMSDAETSLRMFGHAAS